MIKKLSIIFLFFFLLSALILAQPSFVFAQDEPDGTALQGDVLKEGEGVGLKETFGEVGGELPESLPKLDIEGEKEPVKALESFLIKFIINPIFLIAGGVAVIVIMYSAARIIIARGEEEGITAAKNTLIWAAIGLALIMLAYTLVSNLTNIIMGFVS